MILAWIVVFPILLLSALFMLEVIAGVIRIQFDRKSNPLDTPEGRNKIEALNISSVILIPAHNEQLVITDTLDSVSRAVSELDRILVVADNCTDSTANLVRSRGIECTERENNSDRGKGYALAHGVSVIEQMRSPPEVIIILDADCVVNQESIRALKQAAVVCGGAVQGRYLLTAPKKASAQQLVSGFAIWIKNYVRPMGLDWIGGSVPITGSGFAAPLSVFQRANLATGEIVEDMKFGVDVACMGLRVQYIPQVHISSFLPENDSVAEVQRQRWEHGHIGIITSYAPRLFVYGCVKGRWHAILAGLDLLIPPLTLLLAFLFFCIPILFFVGENAGIAALVWILLMGLTLMSANEVSDPRQLSFSDVKGVLKFVMSKFNLYISLGRGRRSGWVKTQRENPSRGKSINQDKE